MLKNKITLNENDNKEKNFDVKSHRDSSEKEYKENNSYLIKKLEEAENEIDVIILL